ncbi:hypothetical protein Acid345_3840 [Candidatus Koribacter versatilis Ellin345]|uniref:TonB-dependent transporter Oar-like beta-barrel domain-containing protein n=1 Tax=Koribacter versatilis (strain Ellin345) TaxID=204669 RepID=Q1IJW0_KORVE|nr:hypothetical protein Acid345_3840 [Candidatus Koribacter versatilis Ellin345]
MKQMRQAIARARIGSPWKSVSTILIMLCLTVGAMAQRITGTLRGQVTDSAGSVVVGAKVTAANQDSGVTEKTATNSAGTYIFPELLPGPYTVTVQSEGFATSAVRDVRVATNVVNDRNVSLAVGGSTTTIDVNAAAETVDLSSSTVATTFDTRETLDIPSGSNSPLQLALFSANTTAQQGGVTGTGGSVSGTRPRSNSFNIDGVDDNNAGTSGQISNVIQDAVAEFNLVTNPFSAEYGHAGGGQFNIVTKTGTNSWHGSGEYYLQNRFLNALDNLTKDAIAQGAIDHTPRLDVSRVGGTIGGPIIKNRWFIFGAYEYFDQRADSLGADIETPTAAGISTLQSLAATPYIANLIGTLPAAQTANSAPLLVNGVSIPTGLVPQVAPNPFKEHDFQINSDLKEGRHELSARFLFNKQDIITAGAISTPEYNLPTTLTNYKAALIDTWSISNTLVNDLRISYSHSLQSLAVPEPFSNNPLIFLADMNGITFGANDPQRILQDVYQVIDTQTKIFGRHTLKYGGEYRHYIAPAFFLQRSNGNYFYLSTQTFINDGVPEIQMLRGAGDPVFPETQSAVGAFLQDDFKVSNRLTLNLGLRYEFTNNPSGAERQAKNAISNVPGVIDFHAPNTAKLDFEPRIGFAWDPTGTGKTSVRGGIGLGYSPPVNNFNQNAQPPQVQTVLNLGTACFGGLTTAPAWCASGDHFFAQGALPSTYTLAPGPDIPRALTASIMPDTIDARIVNWSLGIQREVYAGGVLDVRYVGSRSFHLPTQIRLNSISAFDAGLTALPTYFSNSEVPSAVPNPASTQADFKTFLANQGFAPYSQYGFVNVLTEIGPFGASVYHGASVSFTQSLRHGLTMRANYTWSHNIDNATNELNSSSVNPRRAEDSYDLDAERGNSVLDVRHKFAVAWTYHTPNLTSGSRLLRALANGYEINGDFIAQTGQPVTILSPYDANANGDTAGERAIFNPHGSQNLSTDVNFVCNDGSGGATRIVNPQDAAATPCSPSNVVGYVSMNSGAAFVASQLGARSNLGRDTVYSPGFGVWNASLGKSFRVTEGKSFLARVEVYDVFNHRNFTVAGPVTVFGTATGLQAFNLGYVQTGSSQFLDSKQFTGGARALQLVFKFIF